MSKFLLSAVSLSLVSSAAIAQGPAESAPPMPSIEQIFAFLDADKDGFIQKTEAQGPMVEHFAMIDGDKDEKVSPAELQTAMDMRDKMRAGSPKAEPAATSAPNAN
jgi:Ca2+-binding EF-hand superfamily protein